MRTLNFTMHFPSVDEGDIDRKRQQHGEVKQHSIAETGFMMK
jgi:hypothetical protein